jgi:hypothetical protein
VTTIWLASIAAVSFSGRVPSMAASAALISVCSLGRRLNSASTKSLLVVPKVSSNVWINSRNGWAEGMPEEFYIVSALLMVERLSDEGAKLYCKSARVLSAG